MLPEIAPNRIPTTFRTAPLTLLQNRKRRTDPQGKKIGDVVFV